MHLILRRIRRYTVQPPKAAQEARDFSHERFTAIQSPPVTKRIGAAKGKFTVPDNFDELLKLPGVGRKTANVVYAVAFGGDAIAVDTHVFRVSHRLNLSDAKDAEGTEKQLYGLIEDGRRNRAHHLLIFHGRRCCKAQKPLCGVCPVKDICTFGGDNE